MSYFEGSNPIRQRMIEDMTMRRLSPKTQIGYIRGVKKLATFLKRSPEDATAEELRQFQLTLAEQGTSNITINATLSGLTFLFHKSLNRPDVMLKVSTVPVPRKLPTVLSKEEVKQLIDATHSIKYKAAFSVAYGAGLRIGEVAMLKVTDIDSSRMLLRVEQGKGKKDRMAMLSPMLLSTLRQWYKHAKAHHLMLPGGWLFPGQNPLNPLGTRQLSRACQSACLDAGLNKKVSMHTLRHSFATHLEIAVGLETLALRMDRCCQNALRLATYLHGHDKVDNVYYPGLADHPQHFIARELFKGSYGGIFSLDLVEGVDIHKFLNQLKQVLQLVE